MSEIRDDQKYAQLQQLRNPGAPSFQLTPTVKQTMANRIMNTGNSVTGPNDIKPQDYTKISSKDFIERGMANLQANLATANNPFAYAKGVSFNAAHTGKNFDRYYNHPNFKKLGFSPFRDNEKLYNDNSTWADDFSRAKSQYGTLVGTGISSMFKNWGSLASSAPDTDSAWEMEKAMAVGMSSKKGFGAGFTNFYLNSAYTVGIISEIALEEVALGLATAATGGGAGGLAITRTAQNIGRFGKGLANLFKSADKINDARKLLTNTGKGVLNFINPVENLTDLAKATSLEKGQFFIKNAEGSMDAVTKSFMLRQGLGAAIKDARAINAVSSESKLEAGMVQNEVANKLIDQFYEEKGRMPQGKEADFIASRAKEAGHKTFLANLGGIYISNKIVLDTAMKGFKPLRNIINDAGSDFMHAIKKVKGGGKTVSLVDTKSFGKYFKKDYYKAIGQSMTPKKILGSSLRYTSANLAEGFQELYQESLSAGLIDHYTNKHFHDGRVGEADIWDALSFGSGELDKNDQGAEIFLSGFAMGGFLGPMQHLVFNQGGKAFGYAKDYFQGTKTMAEASANREAIKTRLEKSLTAIVNDPAKFANALSENVRMQDDFVNLGLDAEERGDKKGANDAKDDSMFNHIHTLLQHGKYDIFLDQLKDLKNLKADEMASAFGNNDPSNIIADDFNKDVYGRIDSAVARAEGIKERYDTYTRKYTNPFNKNNPEEIFDWLGFEQTRKMAIFSDYTFDRAAKRMNGIFNYLTKVSPLRPQDAGRITSLLDDNLLDAEVKRLELEAKTYSESSEIDIREKGTKIKEQLEALKDVRAAMINYRSSYDQAKKAALNPEIENEMKNTRSMYTAGTIVEFQKGKNIIKGKVIRAADSSKVQIEFTNEKGEKVKDYIKRDKLSIVGESVASEEKLDEEGASQTAFVEENRNLLFDAYQAYLKAIAKESGDILHFDNVQKSFAGILDHIELRDDASKMSEQVAKFLDPEFFAKSSKRMSEILKQAQINAKGKLKDQLEAFLNRNVQNDFFNALDEIKVFFNPEEIEAFINEGKVPNSFLDAESLTIIEPSDPRYKQIIDLLEKYEELTGRTLSGKPLAEVEALAGRLIPIKDENDNRTINDLAKSLNFDPKKGGTVKVKDLLNYVIESDNASEVEKKLAQKLLTSIDLNFIALIDLNHNSNVTFDSTNGLVIDPRFSTKDYAQGKVRFEYSILTGVSRLITDSALQDSEFNGKINILIEQVKNAIKDGRVNNTLAALGYETQDIFGLQNESDFVAEALNNPAFQQLLENITVENTEKNLWEELLDSIKSVLKKILGVRSDSNTALNQAIALISNKFDPSGSAFSKADVLAQSKSQISVGTPFEEMPEDLKAVLTQVYTGDIADINSWIQNSTEARNLINAYNKGNKPVEETQSQPTTTAEEGPNAISEKQKIQLRALGYNSTDINAMSYDEAVKIIGAKTKKGDTSGIPFMITQKMEKQLKDMGYTQEEINKMTPEQANNIINNNLTKAQPAAPTPVSNKKADWVNNFSNIKNELSKLKTKEEKLQWLADNNYLDPFTQDGKTSNYLKTATGRVVVKIKIGDITIPFYISTGAGEKADVETNKWYVFFGQGEYGFFNKTSGKDINQQYGVKIFQDIANILNDLGSNKDEYEYHKDEKGFINLKWTGAAEDQLKTVIDFITPIQPNSTPDGPKATPEQLAQLKQNIQTVKDRVALELAALTEQPVAPVEEPVVLPIQNGTMSFSPVPTDTFSEYYTFQVKDGKIISGIYNSTFIGENGDRIQNNEIPENELNSTYNRVKNYKRKDIKDTTPTPKAKPGEQLSMFDQEEITPDQTIVVEGLRGKVIYVSPGMNIAEATEADPYIRSGDEYIIDRLAASRIKLFKDVTPGNLTSKIAEFWSQKNISETDEDAYKRAMAQAYTIMTGLSEQGFTVLTHSMYYLNNRQTPIDLVITPSKGSVYKNGDSSVLQITDRRNKELGARATKTHRVTDATNILDVLTGKEKLKNSVLTLTDENMDEQIEALKSIPALEAMRYEVSLMTDAQLVELGFTRDEISEMINNKIDELSKLPDFNEGIQAGDTLIDVDGVLQYVVWHNRGTGEMGIRPVGAANNKPNIVTEKEYPNKIKAIFAKGMEIKETKPEITPEEQKTAEENIKASIAELDPAALREMEDQIDTDEDSALDDINLC
jgi:hypothetical protein